MVIQASVVQIDGSTDSDLIIRVPKKKLTAYKKLFDKKGQSKDTKIQGVA